MFNAYTDSVNSTLSFTAGLEAQQNNLVNNNTWGYQENRFNMIPTSFGVLMQDLGLNPEKDVGTVFIKGENVTKLSVDKDYPPAYFVVRDGSKEYLTRLGNFKYTRTQRAKNTYIGQPMEERTYLTTQDGYMVMGQPIGKGPVTQAKRYRDPLSATDPVFLQSTVQTEEKKIGTQEEIQKGPLVPIDLTRGSNGLILDRYEDLRTSKTGIIEGLRKGLWVPLYQIQLVSVPNENALTKVRQTDYRVETEASGLRQDAAGMARIRSEQVEKSNVNLKLASYDYKKLRNDLNLSLVLQKSNASLFQQFQSILNPT
ncbi:MAG: hypothetical protein ACK481_10705 [Candidatus Melainabacteria bacterium]|jgi:flagellar basal body rod protein FlgG